METDKILLIPVPQPILRTGPIAGKFSLLLFLNISSWNGPILPLRHDSSSSKVPGSDARVWRLSEKLAGVDKKKKWIELGGKRISNESDDLEPVLSLKWFSVPIPVFCDCSLPSIKRNNKHVRTLLTGYWLFFLALLLKQPLKVCFLPCSVGSEACTTSCRRTRGLIRSPNVQFATEEKLILKFFIIYICVCLIKNTSATWEYLKYTACFLCI